MLTVVDNQQRRSTRCCLIEHIDGSTIVGAELLGQPQCTDGSVADVVARIAEELREPNTIARRSRLLELLLSVPVSEYQALVDSLGNELRLDRAFNLRQTMLLRWAKVDPRAALAFAEWLGPT